jgi:hypothetical protein
VRLENGTVVEGEKPLDYYGPLPDGYQAHNDGYVGEGGS